MKQTFVRDTLESYLTRSAKAYLEGQNDWKWIISTMKQTGLNKSEVQLMLLPLKGYGWKFRAQALFDWLETALPTEGDLR